MEAEGGLVGAGNDLTLNIANTITIADGSGVNNRLSVGETILTGTINTTGSQTFQSTGTIEGDVELNAGGDVSFSAKSPVMRMDRLVTLTSPSTRRQTRHLVARSQTWQHSPPMRAAQLLPRPTSPPLATRPTTMSLCSTPA